MVPIVEPEILMDGDHDLARARAPPAGRWACSTRSWRRTGSISPARC